MKLFLSFAGKSNVSISMEKLELMENTYAVFMDRKISHKFRTMDAYFKHKIIDIKLLLEIES